MRESMAEHQMPFVSSQILHSDICYGLFHTQWPSSLLRKEKERDKAEYVSFLFPRLSSLVNARYELRDFFPSLFFVGRWCQQITPAILHQSAGTLLKITHSSMLWILMGRAGAFWVKFSRPALYSIRLSFKSQLKLEAFSEALSGASSIESRDGWKTFHWVHTTSFTVSLLQEGSVGESNPEIYWDSCHTVCKSDTHLYDESSELFHWLICLFSIDSWTFGVAVAQSVERVVHQLEGWRCDPRLLQSACRCL